MRKTLISFTFLTLLFPLLSWASPDKLTFVFLTEQKVSFQRPFIFGQKYAQNGYPSEAYENCKPMGEGCFHPQFGLLPPKDDEQAKKSEAFFPEEKANPYKTLNSRETDLVECREGHYFDIYCGQAKREKPQKQEDFQLWIDISSSIRRVDYTEDHEHCERRIFAEKVSRQCGDRLAVHGYHTAKKEIMDFGNLCQYRGTNSTSRLVRWIENSSVKNLVVVTDVDEMGPELRSYIDRVGAQVKGIGTTELQVTQLPDMVSELFPECSQ